VCHTALDAVSQCLGVEKKYRHCERSEFTPEAIQLNVGQVCPTYKKYKFLLPQGARGIACPTRHAELVSASYQLVVIRPVGQILNNLKITDKCPYFLRFQNDTLNTSLNKPFNSTWRANPC